MTFLRKFWWCFSSMLTGRTINNAPSIQKVMIPLKLFNEKREALCLAFKVSLEIIQLTICISKSCLSCLEPHKVNKFWSHFILRSLENLFPDLWKMSNTWCSYVELASCFFFPTPYSCSSLDSPHPGNKAVEPPEFICSLWLYIPLARYYMLSFKQLRWVSYRIFSTEAKGKSSLFFANNLHSLLTSTIKSNVINLTLQKFSTMSSIKTRWLIFFNFLIFFFFRAFSSHCSTTFFVKLLPKKLASLPKFWETSFFSQIFGENFQVLIFLTRLFFFFILFLLSAFESTFIPISVWSQQK